VVQRPTVVPQRGSREGTWEARGAAQERVRGEARVLGVEITFARISNTRSSNCFAPSGRYIGFPMIIETSGRPQSVKVLRHCHLVFVSCIVSGAY
jgi:hypothetical protein